MNVGQLHDDLSHEKFDLGEIYTGPFVLIGQAKIKSNRDYST